MPFARVASRCLSLVGICMLVLCARAVAQELTVIGFNVDSEDADPQRLAREIRDVEGCDLWGLVEVRNKSWSKTFEAAAEEGEQGRFRAVVGRGGSDLLVILYNRQRLALVKQFELDEIGLSKSGRVPLVGQFRLKGTDHEFLFVVNHFYERRATRRQQQARLLNRWAARQKLPVIAVGTFGFEWEVPGGDADHGAGYDLLTAHDVFRWVRPPSLVATQCDDDFNTVLDFVFAAGEATEWPATSQILFSSTDYCPDDDKKSDHRPVRATFVLGQPEPEPNPLDELRERIDRIEQQLGMTPQAKE